MVQASMRVWCLSMAQQLHHGIPTPMKMLKAGFIFSRRDE
jgi:hypothetical protein